MKDLDGEIFGDDDLSTNAQQQAQNMGMSRRKQHLMAAQEQKTRDKYAEEKEIDVGELQTLDEPAQDDISKQVRLHEPLHLDLRPATCWNRCSAKLWHFLDVLPLLEKENRVHIYCWQ